MITALNDRLLAKEIAAKMACAALEKGHLLVSSPLTTPSSPLAIAAVTEKRGRAATLTLILMNFGGGGSYLVGETKTLRAMEYGMMVSFIFSRRPITDDREPS